MVNDLGLREDHKGAYDRAGRWVLAVAIFAGWVAGLLFEVSEAAIAVLFAFLAGGVIMNVLKEELPEERESRFWAFVLGAGIHAAILCWRLSRAFAQGLSLRGPLLVLKPEKRGA